MRDRFYIGNTGHRVVHTMLTAEVLQKGLKIIDLENILWRYRMKKDDALALLLQHYDFDPTRISSILDENVKRIGAWLDFVPEYHPELNFIDMYLGYS